MQIRALHDARAIREVEEVQREVWGFDDVEVVPLHVLLTTARHGGLLLGAYQDGRMMGFSYAYRGVDLDGTPVLCSHLLAVRPAARGMGLGARLKWAQRQASLEAGVTRIVWTYDPLEFGNARLNLARLGGVSDRYLVDLYGELRDELNAGLPTDRIEIVWELTSDRVARRAAGELPADAAGGLDPSPLLDPDGPGGPVADPGDAPRIRVRTLADAQVMRRSDPDAALAWRLHLRRTLTRSIESGFLLVGAGLGETGPEYHLVRTGQATGLAP